MNATPQIPEYDLQLAVSDRRLVGLWRMMAGYRLRYFGANLSLGLAAGSKTLTYLLLRFLIDDAIGGSRFGLLPVIAAGFLGLALFEGTFTFLSGRLAAQTAEGIALRLRDYIYDHLQRLRFSYHDRTPTGELVQRATSDVDAVRRFFAQQAIGVGRIVLLFLVNFFVILGLNWQLALISVATIPILVVMSYFFFRRISEAYEAYQEQDGVISTTLQENLAGVRVVKA